MSTNRTSLTIAVALVLSLAFLASAPRLAYAESSESLTARSVCEAHELRALKEADSHLEIVIPKNRAMGDFERMQVVSRAFEGALCTRRPAAAKVSEAYKGVGLVVTQVSARLLERRAFACV